MFGKNPVVKANLERTGVLRVVNGAPFFTIQGEGPFAGMAAVFLRLHGCPLRCFFCDTEFSNPTDPELTVTEVANMIEAAAPGWCRLLVITGGEPVRQNLAALIDIMIHDGWTIQVETSGILWQDCLMDTVIVCSPKTPTIHPKIHEHAHAFKYVIKSGEVDVADGLPMTNTQIEGGIAHRLARPRDEADVYLSPMDECDPEKNQRNLAQVAAIAMSYPSYRAGVQLHKLMGLA
jgi:7-carboxy-7-deazaguanine synthase